MMSELPAELWKDAYGELPPLGWILRESLPSRWLRIHSLPDGQRYPSGSADTVTLLHRHNVVGTSLLGDGAPVLLVHASFPSSIDHEIPGCLLSVPLLPADDLPALACEPEIVGDPPFLTPFYSAQVIWRSGVHDAILEAVAQDQVSSILFFSLRTLQVYAPYDGGADLFFNTISSRDSARHTFAPWLSGRADGL